MIGELLHSLNERTFLERSLVIVTADHGDEFFEHGDKGHQRTLYEEVVRIPLIMWAGDGRWKPHVVNQPVELIDVHPTVLTAVGLAADTVEIDGRDLGPTLSGAGVAEAGQRSRARFTDTEVSAKRRGGRRGERVRLSAVERGTVKLIVARGSTEAREMYDLAVDPRERFDIARTETATADSLARSILSRVEAPRRREAHKLGLARNDSTKLSRELEEELRALGYID